MPNVLEVKIIGDVTDLQKSLKQAESLQAQYTASIEKTSNELKESISVTAGYKKAIEDLNTAFKNGSVSSKEYSKQLANLKRDEKESQIATSDLRKELANLKREQKDLGNGFQKDLTPKVANGSNALIQMSRIVQDAPYGFTAIVGNITASGEALSYLVKETGSASGALKALGGSIVGSGGVLLAFSLLTTGIQYMVQNGLSVNDVIKKLTGNFDKARKASQDLNAEVVKNSQGEISSMNAYVSVAKNVNLSMSDRLIAVKKLQDEYPAYFGNLTKEQILNGNVDVAVQGVTKALIAKAKAASLTERIVKLAEEEERIQQDINNAIIEEAKIKGLTAKQSFEASSLINKVLKGNLTFQEAFNAASSSKVAYTVIQAQNVALTELGQNLKANRLEQDRLTKSLEKQTAAQIKTEAPKIKEDKIDVTPRVEAVPQLIPVKSNDEKLDKLLKIMRDQLSEDLTNLKEKGVEVNIPIQAVGQITSFSAYARALKQAEEDTKIFADGAGSAINALAGELTSSLETGNAALDAFVGSVIQGLAQVAAAQLTGLIAKQTVAATSLSTDAAVATGNAVVAATETASATGPAAAFVLPALVGAAIGFIAAAFSGIKFAHGGIVPGGSFTGDKIPAMLNSGETVMNSQQQANTLMAIANGNSNSLQSNRVSTALVLETKLRGADILLSVKREERKR